MRKTGHAVPPPVVPPLRYALGRAFRMPALPGRALPPRRFTAAYYDTEDLRLARAGLALRRRREARRARWQLVLPRGEVEAAGEAAGAAPPASLRAALAIHLRHRRVHLRATVRTHRTGFSVRDRRGPIVDVLADTGIVTVGGRRVRRVHAAELVWRRDDEIAREAIEGALRDAEATPGAPGAELFALLGLPAPAPSPSVTPETTPAAFVRSTVGPQLDVLRAHDPGTRLGRDPEDLHEMRVAARRLRAYLRLLRPMLDPGRVATLRAELAWLGDTLGTVRDLDVFLAYLRAEASALDRADRRAVARLVAALERDRARAQETLLTALGSPPYRALLDRLAALVRRPPLADGTLDVAKLPARAFRKVERAVAALDDPPEDAALHAVRIRGKRARYAAELAAPVIGKPARRFLRAARTFQGVLGEYQDAAVAEARLHRLLAEARGPRAAFVMGRLVERQRLRRQAALATLPAVWRTLRRRGKKVST